MQRLPRVPVPRLGANPVPTGALTEQQLATLVFGDIQAFWSREFSGAGTTYQTAERVIFNGGVETGCGAQPSEVGPFYCPPDHAVFIDLTFLTALQQYIGAEGDFARAYIIAHELGHHVQTLLGITGRVHALSTVNPQSANPLSVRNDLQADCALAASSMLPPMGVESVIRSSSCKAPCTLRCALRWRSKPPRMVHQFRRISQGGSRTSTK